MNKKDMYFEYLYNLCGDRYNNYKNMLYQLYNTPFFSIVPNDDNRGEDGLFIRTQFEDEFGIQIDPMAMPNVLEVLLGIAGRYNRLISSPDVDKTVECLHIMLDNLGLLQFTDRKFVGIELLMNLEIQKILQRFLARTYDSNGRGGLFPLKRSMKDQRNVEIWYQLNEYVQENTF